MIYEEDSKGKLRAVVNEKLVVRYLSRRKISDTFEKKQREKNENGNLNDLE